MPDTIRQQIISAVDAKFKTILTTNGYFTNLGQNVTEWDRRPLAAEETFRLTYRDEEEGRVQATVGEQDIGLMLTIWVLAKSGTSAADIRKMIADVAKAMYADPSWSNLASDTLQDGAVKLDKDEAADVASGAEIKFRVEYSVDRGAA